MTTTWLPSSLACELLKEGSEPCPSPHCILRMSQVCALYFCGITVILIGTLDCFEVLMTYRGPWCHITWEFYGHRSSSPEHTSGWAHEMCRIFKLPFFWNCKGNWKGLPCQIRRGCTVRHTGVSSIPFLCKSPKGFSPYCSVGTFNKLKPSLPLRYLQTFLCENGVFPLCVSEHAFANISLKWKSFFKVKAWVSSPSDTQVRKVVDPQMMQVNLCYEKNAITHTKKLCIAGSPTDGRISLFIMAEFLYSKEIWHQTTAVCSSRI